jgi:hypothetical protein
MIERPASAGFRFATSARIKAGLAAAKARGVRLGNPHLRPGDSATAAEARAAWSASAFQRAVEVLPYVEAAKEAGATTLQQLADWLTARGVRTPGGMERWQPAQVRRLLTRAHPWIRPGATFLEGGEAKRITEIKDGVVHGFRSSGGLWCWRLTSVLAAADTGRIHQAPHDKRQRPPKRKRQRPYLSKAARERLTQIRVHPLVVGSGRELQRLVLRTLQALRNGKPVEPPKLLTLLLVAEAGAEAQNLGRLVAFPERRGGRRSGNEDQARDVQLLLARLDAYIQGYGEFSFGDLQWVGGLAEHGLQAILDPGAADEDRRGRPAGAAPHRTERAISLGLPLARP